jgi:hypothetical protein
MSPTKGFPVSHHTEDSTPSHVPSPEEPSIPELEDDQTIAPRPEEDIADALRATPDVADHSQHSK